MTDRAEGVAETSGNEHAPGAPRQGEYQVVARRYRPQTFAELVGQERVAAALAGAIQSQRVGHAYLFTGARGVGKTSAARILAKALNCLAGISPTPCNQCDVCQAVSSGDDVDVLEIDGASNRGIDEMRQLRQNVNVRPSRARFKIYIIDEVHMLTKEAFNALLKTLEEPPEHVKFIFCTTEPEKIPITILSRCQRFDFAGIQTDSIAQRLAQIAAAEGVSVDAEALDLLARRAAGSMRDSQSLLEQLLSVCGPTIAADDVHRLLGTAGDARLAAIARSLLDRDPATALRELDQAIDQGVDVGQLLTQLLGHFRDLMVAVVGGPPELFRYTSRGQWPAVQQAATNLGVATVLAIVQILETTLSRLRYSSQSRVLSEMALVRIGHLEDLDQLSDLLSQPMARDGNQQAAVTERPAPPARPPVGVPNSDVSRPAAAEPAKKKSPNHPAEAVIPPVEQTVTSSQEAVSGHQPVLQAWEQLLASMGDMTAQFASHASRVAISAPNRLVVLFEPKYTSSKSYCERSDRQARLEQGLLEATGDRWRIEFELLPSEPDSTVGSQAVPIRNQTPQERLREKSQHPLIQRLVELFDARPMKVD